MKSPMKTFAFSLIALLLIAGCSSAPATPAPTDTPAATTTPKPSPTPVQAWVVVGSASFSQPVNYAGFLDASFGITVGYAGEVHYSTDGGASWPKADNTSMCRFGLDIIDTQTAWNCGNGGHMRVSTDGGKTWKAVTNYGQMEPNQCRMLSFLDATTGWAAAPAQLGMTQDGGQTWKDLKLPEGITNIVAISLVDANKGFLLDAGGTLFTTVDGGETWTSQKLDFADKAFFGKTAAPSVAMRFQDQSNGMIVVPTGNTDSGYVVTSAYTTDGGKTWKLEPVPVETGIPGVYLSHDGKLLSVISQITKQITLLKYQG